MYSVSLALYSLRFVSTFRLHTDSTYDPPTLSRARALSLSLFLSRLLSHSLSLTLSLSLSLIIWIHHFDVYLVHCSA